MAKYGVNFIELWIAIDDPKAQAPLVNPPDPTLVSARLVHRSAGWGVTEDSSTP